MKRILKYCPIAIVAGLLGPFAGAANAQSYKMISGTLTGTNAGKVRLLWIVDGGWLESEGYVLFRQVGATDAKTELLTPKPIRADASVLSDPILSRVTPINSPKAFVRASSSDVFRSVANDIKPILQNPRAKISKAKIATIRAKNSMLLDLRHKIGIPPTSSQGPMSPDEMSEQARSQVLLRGLSDIKSAEALGITFVDSKVDTGMKIHYILRKYNKDFTVKMPDLATCDIVVGSDPMPPAAIVEDPIQTGANTIQLHFEAPTTVDQSAFGLLRYQVLRKDSTWNTNIPISNQPVLLNYTSVEGKMVPTVTSYTDSGIAVGPVEYTIQTIDAFGRMTSAAPKTTQLIDTMSPNDVPWVLPIIDKGFVGGPLVVLCGVTDTADPIGMFGAALDQSGSYRLERIESDPNNPTIIGTFSKSNFTGWGVSNLGGMGSKYGLTASGTDTSIPLESLTVRQFRQFRPEAVRYFFETASAKGIAASEISNIEDVAVRNLPSTVASYLEQCLGNIGYIPMVDPNPPADKSVTYRVVAVLTRNNRESDPVKAQTVTIPTFIAPVLGVAPSAVDQDPPSDVNSVTIAKTKSLMIGAIATKAPSDDKRKWIRAVKNGLLNGASLADPLNDPAPDPTSAMALNRKQTIGRAVALSWPQVNFTSPVRYRVYRALAYAYPIDASTPVGKRIFNQLVDVSKIPISSYVFLGTTNPGETQFLDILPRSYRLNYVYKVVPVSRWNYAGPASGLAVVSVKATMAPSVPVVSAGIATMESNGVAAVGKIRVAVKTNGPTEGVSSYVVYRKMVTEPDAATPSSTAGATTIGTTGLRHITVPTLPKLAKNPKSYIVVPTAGTRPLAALSPNGHGGAAMGVVRSDVSTVLLGSAAKSALGQAASQKRTTVMLTPQMIEWLDLSTYTKLNITPTVTPDSATFVDADLAAGAHYLYRIVAINSDGLASSPSGLVDVTPVKISADPATHGTSRYDESSNSITLGWVSPASGAVSYIVERAIDKASASIFLPLDTVTVAANSAAPGYMDTNVRPGQKYIYRIITMDSEGNISKRVANGTKVVSGTLDISVTAQ